MQSIITFWDDNYANILISLGIGFVFFVLGPMGLWFSGRKIRKERIEKAKEMMIDLVEGMIVNQEEITNSKLRKLFGAIEREVVVSMDSAYDLERLFEDVALRFQRSKHLDAQQKNEYSNKLTELSDSLKEIEDKEDKKVLPRKYSEVISSLKEALDNSDKEAAQKNISELSDKLKRVEIADDPVFRVLYLYKKLLRERPWVVVVTMLGYAIFIGLIIYFDKIQP